MSTCWRTVVLFTALLPATAALGADAAPAHVRRFQIQYTAAIPAPPPGAQHLRVWLPYPETDAWQTIDGLIVTAPFAHSVRHDREYGNSLLFLEAQSPPANGGEVTMTFAVTRREYVNRPEGPHPAAANHTDAKLLARFRQPDKLVPLQGKIAAVARGATKDAHTAPEQARAIYDYVTTNLRYDKSGSGWGRGDAIWACDNKRGNCTDFHSLLIGMARSVGIPAKFEIGLPVPDGQAEGTIGGYHCWAAFYLDGIGWVPVDSSEASKNPAKRDYFFGALDANRVRLSVGRDITLDPAQQGGPVNYLVYPYAEVDGRPLPGVTQTFTFRDLDRPVGH
jgi:transglutaminase-like putative cysteine protease